MSDELRVAQSGRNVSIDALRTVSILVVVLLHTAVYLNLSGLIPADSGYYGVSLFFVISGYLITSGALNRFGDVAGVKPWSFYRSRASRIAPGLVLFVLLNVALWLAGVPEFELIKKDAGAIWELLFYVLTFQANGYWAQGFLPKNWIVLWSLGIEEVFYLCFPLACYLFQSRRKLACFFVAVFLLGLLVRYWAGGAALYYNTGCFGHLALGCIIAVAMPSIDLRGYAALALRILGVGIWACVFFNVHVSNFFGPVGAAVGGALFIAGSVGARRQLTPLSAKIAHVATLPGQWSYEIYLFHTAILLTLFNTGEIEYARQTIGSHWNLAIVLGVITAVSGVVSVYVLAPMSQRIRGRRSTAQISGDLRGGHASLASAL